MTARAGMAELILRARQAAEAGTADYAVAGLTYWTDDQVQAYFDRERRYEVAVPLTARPVNIAGVTQYFRYELPRNLAVEGTAGGSAVFRIDTSTGAIIISGYTFDTNDLSVVFSADRGGTAYYWTGYHYDINAVVRALWLTKAAHAWTAINFSADGARFERGALQANCLRMAELFGYRGGPRVTKLRRLDVVAAPDAEEF